MIIFIFISSHWTVVEWSSRLSRNPMFAGSSLIRVYSKLDIRCRREGVRLKSKVDCLRQLEFDFKGQALKKIP